MNLVQGLALIVQIGYLAAVSRLIDVSAFASFGVGLAISVFVSSLIEAFLANPVARRRGGSVSGDRALVSWIILVGTCAAIFIASLSNIIGDLWNNSNSSELIALLAWTVPLSALQAAILGMLVRERQMRQLGRARLASLSVASAVGIVVVLQTSSPLALAIQPLLTSASFILIAATSVWPRAKPGSFRGVEINDRAFGKQSGILSVWTAFINAFQQWSLSYFFGPIAYANWNRAITTIKTPIDIASKASSTVLVSEFATSRQNYEPVAERNSRILAFLLTALFPTAAIAFPVVPEITRIVLGRSWALASDMSQLVLVFACAVGALTVVNTLLDSSGNFRIHAIGVGVLLIGSGLTVVLLVRDFGEFVALAALAATSIASLMAELLLAIRVGILSARPFLRPQAVPLAVTALALAQSALVVSLTSSTFILLGNWALLTLAWLVFLRVHYRSVTKDA